MRATADSLARLVGGARVGPDRAFTDVKPLADAGPDDLAFHDKGAPGAAGVLLTRAPLEGRTCVVVADPLAALVRALATLAPEHAPCVHPGAHVMPGAQIGEGTTIFPGAVIYPWVRIGRNCRIHGGAVIGADGFRYHPGPDGPVRVPHLRGVVVEDDVDIGANTTVDRGFLADTVIGRGSRLDNQVHVGHNCRIGRHVIMAAQVGLSGSVEVGDGAILGGKVGVAEHVRIGRGARVGATSAVQRDVPDGETWLGYPARPIHEARRVLASMSYLPELVKLLRGR